MAIPADKLPEDKKQGLEQYVDITFLDDNNAQFDRTEGGILILKYQDENYNRIKLYKIFPFHLDDQYISVRDKDNNEIGIIKSLDDLNNKMRKLVKEELDWIYFCPDIQKIYSIEEEFGYTYWKVETDQGKREFTLRGNNGLTPITETRIMINDIEGNRYQIKNTENLDRNSLKQIELIL